VVKELCDVLTDKCQKSEVAGSLEKDLLIDGFRKGKIVSESVDYYTL